MEYMTERDLAQWLQLHGGERGREPYYESRAGVDEYGDPTTPTRQRVGVKIVARDGATLVVGRNEAVTGLYGPDQPEYIVHAKMDAEPDKETKRTPEQIRSDAALAQEREFKNTQEIRENNERSWNQNNVAEGGSGRPETHAERAEREAKERQEERAQAQLEMQRETARRQAEADAQRNIENAADRAERARQANQSTEVQREQLEETRRANQARENKPEFLSQADTKSRQLVTYIPGQGIVTVDNPNFDAVKAEAEERRAELASQVQLGQLKLEEAKQQYTQWFDTNVRVPLMQSQEARARAEERRQALEAEERRRQFAANYKLQKAQLGETAAQRATQAEISLLPYRSGPTWGEDISSAINSLAQGGSLDKNASAGIHFSDSSFAFDRPDFDRIAKDAAKAALSGLTDYRPSSQQFETGDYSGVPAVNTSGMPSYSFAGVSLPAPSPGAAEPPPE